MSDKRHRVRKSLSLEQLKKRMTQAINRLESILLREDVDDERILNACTKLSQMASSYCKVYELTDIQERLDELENKVDAKITNKKN